MNPKQFEKLVEDYLLRECLILDEEYRTQGINIEQEGILESELKDRVKMRMLSEHPELREQIVTDL